jgi:hypothetical protein
MELPEQNRETFDLYVKRGFAARVGFGQRPALLVIDIIRAFTDLRSPRAAPRLRTRRLTTAEVLPSTASCCVDPTTGFPSRQLLRVCRV